MLEDEITHADHVQLRQRGWTRGLIAKFLKQPDRWGTVQHWKNYTGKALYSVERVMSTEAILEFKAAYGASVRRRMLPVEAVGQIAAARESGNDAYRKWLKGVGPEQVRLMVVAQEVETILSGAIAQGYRTPHK